MSQRYMLTIAIPIFNRCSFLDRSLRRLLPKCDDRIEILVSDNASDEDILGLLKKKYPQVKYYRNEVNRGADYNFLQCYIRAQGEYILLLGSDDIITEDGIDHIMRFLLNQENKSPLIYLNNGLFMTEYNGLESLFKVYYKKLNDPDFCVRSKEKFISIARHRITFMSCLLLSKKAFLSISEPERFIGTSFIHTCIALESTSTASCYGIIPYPCIAANATPGDAGLDNDFYKSMSVFGDSMHHVLCEFAVDCGYNKKQMRNIYLETVKSIFPRRIISTRVLIERSPDRELKKKGFRNCFEKYMKPVFSKYPQSWIHIFIPYYMPIAVLSLLYYSINLFRKKR